jgi:hypothetical protein
VLERQIDYGAKLGHVVLSLARMELNNFYKNVMPVADYFDQRGMMYAVSCMWPVTSHFSLRFAQFGIFSILYFSVLLHQCITYTHSLEY